MAEKNGFATSKEQLLSTRILDLVVVCDASTYGVGAILFHRMPDGTERPIRLVYHEPLWRWQRL